MLANWTDDNSSVSWLDVDVLPMREDGGGRMSSHGIPRRDPLYTVIPMTCLYAIILVSGLVGNISACVVIALNKYMHTATNYYLFSLAISDLLLLTGLPTEMYYIWSRFPYVFGEVFCRSMSFVQETSANAMVLTITTFTVERYVAICHPFLSDTVSKLSRAIKFIVVIWVLALCLAVPPAIQYGMVSMAKVNGTDDPESVMCSLKFEFTKLKLAFPVSTCLFFVVPMTLITILYIRIGLKVRRSRLINLPSSEATQPQQSSTTSRNHNHVIRMLFAVVVAFFICWAPFHCQRLLAVYAISITDHVPALNAVYNALPYVSRVLYYLSTCVNPLLYHTMSHKFRQAFKATLAQLCSCGQEQPAVPEPHHPVARGSPEHPGPPVPGLLHDQGDDANGEALGSCSPPTRPQECRSP